MDTEKKMPLNNLSVFIELKTRKKNNYTFGPKVSNEEGAVTFEREAVKNEIYETLKEFPMDYVSTLSECEDIFKIIVGGKNEILKRFNYVKAYYPDEAEKLNKIISKLRILEKGELVYECKLQDTISLFI